MPDNGVRSTDLDTIGLVDDLIGNAGGNIGRIPLATLAAPGIIVKRVYEDVPALQASVEPARGVGAEWRDLGGHLCREVAPDSEDYLIRTSAGVKLQVARGLWAWW